MNFIPWVGFFKGMLEKLDKMQGIQRAKMSVKQRKEALFQQLYLSGLEGWSAKNQATPHALLAECHDIFSLEPGQLGWTALEKHEIKVTDGSFQKIPPPVVDKAHTYMKEMLEVGMNCPSQSP